MAWKSGYEDDYKVDVTFEGVSVRSLKMFEMAMGPHEDAGELLSQAMELLSKHRMSYDLDAWQRHYDAVQRQTLEQQKQELGTSGPDNVVEP